MGATFADGTLLSFMPFPADYQTDVPYILGIGRQEMNMPTLTENEQLIILAALAAISPSGGGSAQYSLYRKLRDAFGADDADAINAKAIEFQAIAVREATEE